MFDALHKAFCVNIHQWFVRTITHGIDTARLKQPPQRLGEERISVHDEVMLAEELSVDAVEQTAKDLQDDALIPLAGDMRDADLPAAS